MTELEIRQQLRLKLARVKNRYTGTAEKEVGSGIAERLRELEATGKRVADQMKGIDQLIASLGRDAKKLNAVVENFGNQLKQQEERLNAFEERLASFSDGGEDPAEKEATAQVMASLSRLVETLKGQAVANG